MASSPGDLTPASSASESPESLVGEGTAPLPVDCAGSATTTNASGSAMLRNVTNGIWHAFIALHHDPTTATVSKSKLKVLTANIGGLFDLYGVERGLEQYQPSTSALHFDHFHRYLLNEVFANVGLNTDRDGNNGCGHMSLAAMRAYEARIEEICWLICRRNYPTDDSTDTCSLPDAYRFKLFRIFCMLADLVTRNGRRSQCEVLLHASEAAHILRQLMHGIGLDADTNARYTDLCSDEAPALTFDAFLAVFGECGAAADAPGGESLCEAIEELFQTYINDVIKKGYLWRRGYLLPTLKEYWFVLQPCELTFYKNATQRDLCGTIALDADGCMVRPATVAAVSGGGPHIGAAPARSHSPAAAAAANLLPASHERSNHRRFSLSARERHFELAAADHRSRLQWIASLQLAITYSSAGGRDGYQRDQAARRRKRRALEQRRRAELELQRCRHRDEVNAARTQLEHERLARQAAEMQARELQRVARADSRRVAELEDVKVTLERLLVEEQQAKRDEEIVRALQARVLAEEWDKRAELEQLQEEQRVVLEREREKRREFEQIQREREQRLREAEQRLRQLEDERVKLDAELHQARSKIRQSENGQKALEDRLLVGGDQALLANRSAGGGSGGERLRRALSFMHSERDRSAFGGTYDVSPLCVPVRRSRSKSPLTLSHVVL